MWEDKEVFGIKQKALAMKSFIIHFYALFLASLRQWLFCYQKPHQTKRAETIISDKSEHRWFNCMAAVCIVSTHTESESKNISYIKLFLLFCLWSFSSSSTSQQQKRSEWKFRSTRWKWRSWGWCVACKANSITHTFRTDLFDLPLRRL